jgi:hypothetical protein
MTKREVLLEAYRANVDVILPADAPAWFAENFVYDGGQWFSREDPGQVFGIDFGPEGPNFEVASFVTKPGDGTPACRCYRCGDLLTLNTLLADLMGEHTRPICAPCATAVNDV